MKFQFVTVGRTAHILETASGYILVIRMLVSIIKDTTHKSSYKLWHLLKERLQDSKSNRIRIITVNPSWVSTAATLAIIVYATSEVKLIKEDDGRFDVPNFVTT